MKSPSSSAGPAWRPSVTAAPLPEPRRQTPAPSAPAAADAVAAGGDAGEQHEDRGDDGDDRREAERDAQRVDERRKQYSDQNSDHFQPLPEDRRYIHTSRPTITDQSDLSIARCRRQRRGRGGARRRATRRCRPRAKGVSADLVTDADAAAEPPRSRSSARTARTTRSSARRAPTTPATSDRRWSIDGIDGTVAFAAGLPAAGAARSRSRTSTVRSPPRSTTRSASSTPPPAARARRSTASRVQLRAARPLDEAHVATFLRQDRLVAARRPRERPRAARRSRPAPPRRPGLARARLGRRRPPRRLDPARDRPVGLAPRRAAGHRGRRRRHASSSARRAGTSPARQRWLTRLVALLT